MCVCLYVCTCARAFITYIKLTYMKFEYMLYYYYCNVFTLTFTAA